MKVGDKINCWTIININPPPEHRYHILCRCVLGTFKKLENAVKARRKAEGQYFQNE